ncbi:MAG: redox-regulated ATPase YchF [Holosporales bacterium]|jgi:GTP-binding protein YchF|nr:redox-regulated ATPase YchF [Holosporales bacterium]
MGLNCGIVGLPNVGKSTLFNALTQTAAAQAANYPFCTIDPNIGLVDVPDQRLDKLAELAHSAKKINAQLEIVDIAGLVKKASEGEGLGNQFLGHIREVDAILHVLRCFEDDDITHVEGSIDPIRDAEIVETELMLADLDSLQKRQTALEKKHRIDKGPEIGLTLSLVNRAIDSLAKSIPARKIVLDDPEETKLFNGLQLLTSKPVLYVCNVPEDEILSGNKFTEQVAELAKKENSRVVIVSAAIEAEIALLSDDNERREYLASIGLTEAGLSRMIHEGYQLLDLITFFTAGEKESRAWTIKRGAKAPEAAGVIHTDFQRGFICAETVAYDDYVSLGGELPSKNAGKVRLEGKEYILKDGDIIHFRFNI